MSVLLKTDRLYRYRERSSPTLSYCALRASPDKTKATQARSKCKLSLAFEIVSWV